MFDEVCIILQSLFSIRIYFIRLRIEAEIRKILRI